MSRKINPVDDVSMPILAHGCTFGNAGPRAVFIYGLRRELEGVHVGQLVSTHLARGSRKPLDGDGVLIDTDNFALRCGTERDGPERGRPGSPSRSLGASREGLIAPSVQSTAEGRGERRCSNSPLIIQ